MTTKTKYFDYPKKTIGFMFMFMLLAALFVATNTKAATIVLAPNDVLTDVSAGDTVELGGEFNSDVSGVEWGFRFPSDLELEFTLAPPVSILASVTREDGGSRVITQLPMTGPFGDLIQPGESWTFTIGGSDERQYLSVLADIGSDDDRFSASDAFSTTLISLDESPPDYGGGKGDSGTTAPIPLPAAGWLMLAGFGALAALRRRQAKTA